VPFQTRNARQGRRLERVPLLQCITTSCGTVRRRLRRGHAEDPHRAVETLLLAETPIVVGYFYNYLTATTKGVTGVYPTAVGHLFLYDAAKS
jgi:hypothetical protein